MFDPMLQADGLSGLNRRKRSNDSSRPGRRRTNRRYHLAADVLQLEERRLMTGDPMVPQGSDTPLSSIFWNGGGPTSGTGPNSFIPGITAQPTVRTITITNTSSQTIYPILRDANVGQDPKNNGGANNPLNYYDPQDYQDQEYRAYIGYQSNSGQFLGLPTNSTITIQVPLVFWDAENTYISVDGANLIPNQATGTANISGGQVTSITVTNPGSGYATSPLVVPGGPNPGGTDFIATANVSSGMVTSFTISNAGSNYTTAPTVQILPPPNPFTYDSTAARGLAVQNGANSSWIVSSNIAGGADQGLVMFYHATSSSTPAPDAPAQLTEFTIRDPYLTHWLSDTAQTGILFNYDVSYVDNLVAPIAMEASNVPIPNQAAPVNQNYGWAGANLIYGPVTTTGSMANLVQSFISNTGSASVGQYFGGEGWPDYFNPDGTLKIPSGANIFANSPENGQRSAYSQNGLNNQWMLTSGGTGPIQVSAGLQGVQSVTQTTFLPTFPPVPDNDPRSQATFFNNLAAMLGPKVDGQYQQEVDFYLTYPGQQGNGPVLGRVTDFSNSGTPSVTVSLLSQLPMTGTPGILLIKPATDYAATAITNVWYSWVNFYLTSPQIANFTSITGVTGTIQGATPNVLQVTSTFPSTLQVGCTVTLTSGVGVTAAPGTTVTVLGFNATTKQIIFSQGANGKGPFNGTYTIGKPLPMPFTDPTGIEQITITNPGGGYDPTNPPKVMIMGGSGSGATGIAIVSNSGTTKGQITGIAITNSGTGYSLTSLPTITFGSGSASAMVSQVGTPVRTYTITTAGQTQLNPAFKFAASVYEAMAAENSIVTYPGNSPLLPPAMSLIYTVIGCDVQDLPNSGNGNLNTPTSVGSQVTDVIKSVLRGVYDFTQVPEFSGSTHNWYPNPATMTGGQQFNVYNLDPYVWFVHTVLNFSGYGFSVDDDTSDVGAAGLPGAKAGDPPTNLQIIFGSINSITDPNFNKNPWYASLQWGPLTVTGVTLAPTTYTNAKGQTVQGTLATFQRTQANLKAFWQISNPSQTVPGAFVIGVGKTLIPQGTIVVKYASTSQLELILSNTNITSTVSNVTLQFDGKLPAQTTSSASGAGASTSGSKAGAAIVFAPSSANNSSSGTNIGVIDASMFVSDLSTTTTKKATRVN